MVFLVAPHRIWVHSFANLTLMVWKIPFKAFSTLLRLLLKMIALDFFKKSSIASTMRLYTPGPVHMLISNHKMDC